MFLQSVHVIVAVSGHRGQIWVAVEIDVMMLTNVCGFFFDCRWLVRLNRLVSDGSWSLYTDGQTVETKEGGDNKRRQTQRPVSSETVSVGSKHLVASQFRQQHGSVRQHCGVTIASLMKN